jgi:hypothetical protein
MKLPIFFLFSLFLSTICSACAWDDDTLSIEAKGLPTVVDAIVGRLDINPPEYFTLRLKLSQERIDRDANDYEAYDNIAVAQDKLGNYKAAAEILAKKRARLEQNNVKPTKDPLRDPWYRYHANLGTVYAHQWVGEKRGGDITLLDKAIQQIKRAIEINPKAHFNRERVQLELLKVLETSSNPRKDANSVDFSKEEWRKIVDQVGEKAATEAVIGIMLMGISADSPDTIAMLAMVAPTNAVFVTSLANYRVEELESEGTELRILRRDDVYPWGMPRNEEVLKKQYAALRENAIQYRSQRQEFILAKVAEGKHPDNDPSFWNDFKPVATVNIAAMEPAKPLLNRPQSAFLLAVSVATAFVLLLFFASRRIKQRRKAS